MSSKRAAILIIGVLVCAPLLVLHHLGTFREVSDWLESLYRQVFILPRTDLQRVVPLQYMFYTFMAFFTAWVCSDLPRLSLKFSCMIASAFLTLLLSPALVLNGILFEPFSGVIAIFAAGLLGIVTSGSEKNLRSQLMRRWFVGRISEQKFDQLMASKEPPSLTVRRPVTAVTCQMLNSSELGTDLAPDKLEQLSRGFLSPVAEFLVSRGAYVDSCSGDGLRALFSFPIADEQHAVAACTAAIELLPTLSLLAREMETRLGKMPTFGIAIATGEATCGMFGSGELQCYSAIGSPMDLARQLCQLNLIYGSQILLDSRTYHLAQSAIEVRPMEMVFAAKSQSVGEIYELLAGKNGLSERESKARDAFWQGVVHLRKADYKSALESFQKACIEDRNDPPLAYFTERAEALSKDGSPPEIKGGSRHARMLMDG